MRVIAIKDAKLPSEIKLIDEMFQLRARVFAHRLKWNVVADNGREIDEFDALDPTYILVVDDMQRLRGCLRLLPALGVTMLSKAFKQLLQGRPLRTHRRMIESSRFCVDTAIDARRGGQFSHEATLTLFAGIIEWSGLHEYCEILTVTDVRLERILRMVGWPMQRISAPQMIGDTNSVAGILPVDNSVFDHLRPASYRSDFERSAVGAMPSKRSLVRMLNSFGGIRQDP